MNSYNAEMAQVLFLELNIIVIKYLHPFLHVQQLADSDCFTTNDLKEIDERARGNAMKEFEEKKDKNNYFRVKYERDLIDSLTNQFKKIEDCNDNKLEHLAEVSVFLTTTK